MYNDGVEDRPDIGYCDPWKSPPLPVDGQVSINIELDEDRWGDKPVDGHLGMQPRPFKGPDCRCDPPHRKRASLESADSWVQGATRRWPGVR